METKDLEKNPNTAADYSQSEKLNKAYLENGLKSDELDKDQKSKEEPAQQENHSVEVLSEHAERFRMRLIRNFRLLENLNEMEIILETPKYLPNDLTDEATRLELIEHNPYALVKFSAISKRYGTITKQERRWRRIQCRETSYPPLDLWANWIVESNWFQLILLLVIVTNAALLIIEGEIGVGYINNPSSEQAVKVIRTIDYCCLGIFMLEIFLKWIDDFKLFWQNGWNQLDFCVTILSVLPEILQWFTINNQVNAGTTLFATLGFLRVLRITRLLKIVSRFEQARIILLSVSKAFSAMSFILLLLALFMWIFALMGQVIFVRYTHYDGREEGVQLLYQNAFSGILWSFATLFQLMTLDHWLETLNDILRVMTGSFETVITVFFVLSWLWIGSFVFKNIFAGIMVNNFQTIRNDLHWEKKEKEARFEVDKFKKEITDEVMKREPSKQEHIKIPGARSLANFSKEEKLENEFAVTEDKDMTKTVGSVPAFRVESGMSLMSYISNLAAPKDNHPSKDKLKKAKWENIVQRHLELSHKVPGEVIWSRDVLFKYFQTMEMMQENLTERNEIIQLLNQAVLQMHDN